MVKLEPYGNIQKKAEDLLKNNYIYSKLFRVHLTAKNNSGLELKSRASQLNQSGQLEFTGSTALTYSQKDVKLSVKSSSLGGFRVTAEAKPQQYVKDLKIKAEAKCNQLKQTCSRTLTLEHNFDHVKAKLQVTDGPVAKLQVAAGKDGIGLGIDTGYNFATSSVVAYNIAAFWFAKHQQIALKHTTKTLNLGAFDLSFYQKLNKDTKIAATLNYSQGNQPTIKFGGSHKCCENSLLCAKVCSDGKVSGALHTKLNQHVNITFAGEVNALKITPNSLGEFQVGFKLDLA